MIRVDKLMELRGLKVKDLKQKVHISQSHASGIKTGKKSPSLELAKEIATLLAHPVTDIDFGYALKE